MSQTRAQLLKGFGNTSAPDDAFTIDSSGKVGIASTSPSAKLDCRVATNNPTAGSPAAGSFLQIRGDTASVGEGPSLALMNLSGSKETGFRISAVQNSTNNGDLTFHGYPGGASYSELVRIRSAGGLTFNGDTAAVNALDDYEEGTWSATLVTGTCNTADGKYIKIGNWVRVSATLTGFSNRTSTNLVQINNAPFASNGGQAAMAAGSMFGRNLDRTAFASYMSSTGNVEFYSIGAGTWAALEHQHLNASTSTIYFQAQWQTN